MGCASVSMADGGHAAASLYNNLGVDDMSPIEWRVFPRSALPLDKLSREACAPAPLPSLLNGVLASRRLHLRRSRLGSRFYYCGLSGAVAHVQGEQAICTTLPGSGRLIGATVF